MRACSVSVVCGPPSLAVAPRNDPHVDRLQNAYMRRQLRSKRQEGAASCDLDKVSATLRRTVVVPSMGESMTEGTIATVLKKSGTHLRSPVMRALPRVLPVLC